MSLHRLLLALLAAQLCCTQKNAQLGPGRGPWRVDSPEAHGLRTADLNAAAKFVGKIAPTRDCLLVVKDGALIHESYQRGNATTTKQYETDSLGKIFTAGVMGAAVQAGLIDIDRPMSQYGLRPTAKWNRTGVDYWPRVTARHLLNQMSGYGLAVPGSLFSYDSDACEPNLQVARASRHDHSLSLHCCSANHVHIIDMLTDMPPFADIQELSNLLRATVPNASAVSFARRAFAEPLGMPDLFGFDGVIDDGM